MIELSGNEEPAFKVDMDDSMTARAGMILRFCVQWESCKRRGGKDRV